MATTKYSRYYNYVKPVAENKFVRSATPYIFSIVSMAVFIFFAIKPTSTTILQLQKNIENNQKILDQLNTKAQALAEGKHNLDNMDPAAKDKIKNAVPEQTEITFLINSLQASSPQASISALQIQPVTLWDLRPKDKASLTLGDVDFAYNIQGTYQPLLETLANLRRSPRLINIKNVIFNKTEDGGLILSVTGKANFIKYEIISK